MMMNVLVTIELIALIVGLVILLGIGINELILWIKPDLFYIIKEKYRNYKVKKMNK